jgi:hypothetical protein
VTIKKLNPANQGRRSNHGFSSTCLRYRLEGTCLRIAAHILTKFTILRGNVVIRDNRISINRLPTHTLFSMPTERLKILIYFRIFRQDWGAWWSVFKTLAFRAGVGFEIRRMQEDYPAKYSIYTLCIRGKPNPPQWFGSHVRLQVTSTRTTFIIRTVAKHLKMKVV